MTISQTELLPEVLRAVYLERKSGVIEMENAGSRDQLYFLRGELLLDPQHPAVGLIRPHLDNAGGRPAAVPEIQRAMTTLAHELVRDHKVVASFRANDAVASGLVGPLPTILLVMETATWGLGENELLARLGGEDQRFQSADATPALTQLPALEPEMARVLTSLVQPASVRELLRGAAAGRASLLRGLVKLRAAGLVAEVGPKPGQAEDEQILSPRLLEHFLERVAEDLATDPLQVDASEHRRQIGELIAELGSRNHYELLGVDPRTDEEEVLEAYNQLARRVHPSHAGRLGLSGREETIRILFERATEAYLVLSDPRRRASYNTIVGIQLTREIEDSQRQEEKRRMARQHYRRAVKCLSEMDYSLAIDLLKEASRLDPKPEYFARLGAVQAKNPHWHRHSLESYRRAVELSPDDAGIRVGYGEALEVMERDQEAKEQYKQALKLMPDHPGAKDGIERLR